MTGTGQEVDGGQRQRQRPSEASSLLSDLIRAPLDPGYADAASRRAEVGPRTGWRARVARGSALATLVLAGLLLSIAYQRVVAEEPQASKARNDLVADVKAGREESEQLQRRAETLRRDVARMSDEIGAGDEDIATMRGWAAAAGLARVSGKGAVVHLVDAAQQVDPVTGRTAEENPGIVLDRDLQDVVNDLWRFGAEAIAINGQRLTALSTIRAAGGAILVDFRPVTSPYRVVAIGPSNLARMFDGGKTASRFVRYAKAYRMGFAVKRGTDLTVPAASEPRLRSARVPAPATLSPSG